MGSLAGPAYVFLWAYNFNITDKGPLQIYPIDSAKSIYQRNCLTQVKGKPVKTPKIQFFNRRMYRGQLLAFCLVKRDLLRSGLGVSMTRSCLVNAIFFSAFEFTKKEINDLDG